jgi:hypothetical protein
LELSKRNSICSKPRNSSKYFEIHFTPHRKDSLSPLQKKYPLLFLRIICDTAAQCVGKMLKLIMLKKAVYTMTSQNIDLSFWGTLYSTHYALKC